MFKEDKTSLTHYTYIFLYSNPEPTDQHPRVITITLNSQLWVGDTKNLSVAFSHVWLVQVELSWFF